VKIVLRNCMGSVNKKNYPLTVRVAASKRHKEEGGEDDKLGAVMFLQKITTLTSRIHTEDYNHGQEKNRWQNSFHKHSIYIMR